MVDFRIWSTYRLTVGIYAHYCLLWLKKKTNKQAKNTIWETTLPWNNLGSASITFPLIWINPCSEGNPMIGQTQVSNLLLHQHAGSTITTTWDSEGAVPN